MNECDGRWSTWEEAEHGHELAVQYIVSHYAQPGEEPIEITGEEADTSRRGAGVREE